MTYEIVPGADWYSQEPTPEAEAINPVQLLHRWLRGRYLLAAILGGALAVPCAVLGYVAVPPKYTSVGVVNIAPTRPVVLVQNELNQPMTAFDSYVQSEAGTLRSWRVIEFAVKEPKLKAAGWPGLPDGAIELMDGLKVDVPNRGQDIYISVTNENPVKANAAVDAVLEAYQQLSINKQGSEVQTTISSLDAIVKKLQAESEEGRKEAFRIAEQEGTDDLERRRASKHEQVDMLEKLILDYQIRLVPFAGVDEAAPGSGQATAGDVSPEVLAQNDPTLARLLDQRRAISLDLDSLKRRYADGHRAVLQAQDDLATVEQMIRARVGLVSGQESPSDASAQVASPAATARQLRAQLAALRDLRDKAADEAKRLGKLQLQINQEREKASGAEEQLKLAEERLRGLEVERQNGNLARISITQMGSPPLRPSTDRRIPLAVLGAMGGCGVGIGLVALVGIVFPKYRFIGDVEDTSRNVFVFGAVPELDSADPQSRELVAASVHQVRSVIDARLLGTSERALIHVVTSAGAGEGKSTISLRLAKSFAATGRKTLLIDSDMIGRRITAEFGLLGACGFADAVTGADSSGKTVHETPVTDLYLMPCGRTDRVEPEEISAARSGDLLGPLQQVFQAIVIDTGPILGSLEAQSVAAVADEVMLVITRGREVRQVKLAIDRLHRLGAKKIGVVFNRATRQDVERSTSISMTSQRAADVRAHWEHSESNGHAGVGAGEGATRE
ncbi:MAG: hypothetical protein IPJ41_15105 [Phycisphaerales bacterium]|nr:hypothetical protein [Phycisphaerales bacterium]